MRLNRRKSCAPKQRISIGFTSREGVEQILIELVRLALCQPAIERGCFSKIGQNGTGSKYLGGKSN